MAVTPDRLRADVSSADNVRIQRRNVQFVNVVVNANFRRERESAAVGLMKLAHLFREFVSPTPPRDKHVPGQCFRNLNRSHNVPSEFTLEPGTTVTLRTGSGTDAETELYWDAGSPVWNNGGDTVIIRTADGERVLMEEYS